MDYSTPGSIAVIVFKLQCTLQWHCPLLSDCCQFQSSPAFFLPPFLASITAAMAVLTHLVRRMSQQHMHPVYPFCYPPLICLPTPPSGSAGLPPSLSALLSHSSCRPSSLLLPPSPVLRVWCLCALHLPSLHLSLLHGFLPVGSQGNEVPQVRCVMG